MKVKQYELTECFEPIHNKDSEYLFLGTIPSKSSIKRGFYYLGNQNAFWKLISACYEFDFLPLINKYKETNSTQNKNKIIKALYNNHIALSDTIQSCKQKGSLDSDIQNHTISFNKDHITHIIENSNIKYIFCTSKQSYKNLIKSFDGKKQFERYLNEKNIKCYSLYSPSPTAIAYKQFTKDERVTNWTTIVKNCIKEIKNEYNK